MNRSPSFPSFARMVGLAVWIATGALLPILQVQGAERPPNIVLILMDDMGWRDVGFMGNSFVETPHLDALAKRGVKFTQAYASAPNCAPTRACLMSGQYTPRHGIYTVVDPRQPPGSAWHPLLAAESQSELDTNIVTIAEALESGGYATAFFGMWNLGRGRQGPVTPGGQGFQRVVFPENLGFGKDEYWDSEGYYLSDRLTDEVLRFMESKRESPFFVYLADHAVHAPFNPKPELLRKYERKAASMEDRGNDAAYAATIEAVDENVGRIVAWLKKKALTEETLIIFTSDNGGTERYTAPLRGGKGELYEGGIRVPLIVAGAGVKETGRESAMPVTSVDLYPTLLERAGLSPSNGQVLDGISFAAVLRGETTPKRDRMFWHFPCYVGRATPCSAMRQGEFKLIEFFEGGGRVELYNLREDPDEEQNLAKRMPERTEEMLNSLREWQQSTGAALPRGANPDYDPKAERPRGGGGVGGGQGQGEGRRGRRGGPEK